ncbi:MAG: hypothetical protein RJQ09_12310 [Cyclobacteriaceae bacterium]
MANSLNVALTEELKRFIKEQSGDNSLFSTPSEYIRDLVRKDKEQKESENIRKAILSGYRDVMEGRVIKHDDSLKSILLKRRK